MTKISVGDKAPEFTLRDTDKSEKSLNDYAGQHVVLLFFPLAFTGVCTKELCGVRDELNIYKDLDAQVVAISVDSLFTLEQFKAAEKLNFPLLSDFNKEVSRSYGSIYEDFVLGMKGVSKRSAFVISPEGMIKYAEILEDAGQIPNFDNIKKALES